MVAPRKRSWVEVYALPLVLAVISATGGYLAGKQRGTDPTPVPTAVDAAKQLHLDTLRLSGPNKIDGTTVTVSGSLLEPIPSGATIWVASRMQVESHQDPAIRSAGVGFADGPCDVDAAAKTFNCGVVTLGTPKGKGDYYLYVMLAESNAARDFVRILGEQQAGGNYRHIAPPAGISVLGPVSVTRES